MLESDVVLNEWAGLRPWDRSAYVPALSILRLSAFPAAIGPEVGDQTFPGGVGDLPLGDSEAACDAVPFSEPSAAMELVRAFAPIKLFFSLNFSNQLALVTLAVLSELPTVVAKNRALSLMIASESGNPCFW